MPDMMALNSSDRYHYMKALAKLIKEENKTSGGLSNTMAAGG